MTQSTGEAGGLALALFRQLLLEVGATGGDSCRFCSLPTCIPFAQQSFIRRAFDGASLSKPLCGIFGIAKTMSTQEADLLQSKVKGQAVGEPPES